ncbi:A disintegrin and metalloproteinase with thrombospondin motifs 3-like [Mytilus trossulus]|uniref:A disintegrin and metalloproteinase with thrombospondin motifs 3-like n=1 Tax=Mytilus trossulus TaxID=6551 RepID=UPI00300740AB
MNTTKRHLLLLLFVWNISGIFTLSNILSHFGETAGDEILVQVRASERNKRSASGKFHPDRYDLTLAPSGSEVHLALQRNDRLNTHVPTLSLRDQLMKNENDEETEEHVFYQEIENGGSFLVHFNKDRTETMYGIFQSNGSEFVLHSNDTDKTTSHKNGFRKFQIKKAESIGVNDETLYLDTKLKSSIENQKSSGSRRRKRASGTYDIELLIVVDYAIYQRWYGKSLGSTVSQRDQNAVASIRQYYAFVINGMDAMYKNLQTSSFTINILFSGIIIAKTASDAPWTETIKITGVTPNQVDASQMLNLFSSWVKSQSSIPGHDHAMLFTGYEMIKDGSASIAGLAFTGALCQANSQSIVEDKFNFGILTVAAHELGHSLSALHDGTSNLCRASDSFIMTAVSQPQSNSLTASNPWKFSTCSTAYFNTYIDFLTTNNIQCMTTLDPNYNSNALYPERNNLPGQIYNADQQCEHMVGTGSVMCRQQYSGDFSSICSVLWCSTLNNPSQCQSYTAGDGTLCGNKKWCRTGVCTSSSSAPSGSDTCLYGDQVGVIFGNGWTCQDMIVQGPNNCAQTQIQSSCCASCNPTTTAPTTTRATTTRATTTRATTTTATTTRATTTRGTTRALPTQTTRTTASPATGQPGVTVITEEEEKDYLFVIIALFAGATILIVIIIITMTCCCCRKSDTTSKPKQTQKPVQKPVQKRQTSSLRQAQPPRGYLNQAMVYDNVAQPKKGYLNQSMVYDNVVRQSVPKVQRAQRQYSYLQHV